MAPMLKFYAMQPSEYRGLDSDEFAVLGRWMHDYQKAKQEANR